MIRLGFVVPRYGPEVLGGAETFARNLAEFLPPDQDGVTVLTTCARALGFRVVVVPQASAIHHESSTSKPDDLVAFCPWRLGGCASFVSIGQREYGPRSPLWSRRSFAAHCVGTSTPLWSGKTPSMLLPYARLRHRPRKLSSLRIAALPIACLAEEIQKHIENIRKGLEWQTKGLHP